MRLLKGIYGGIVFAAVPQGPPTAVFFCGYCCGYSGYELWVSYKTTPLAAEIMGLNIKQVENAKPKSKAYKLTDSGGLCLLVSQSGARLWRWRYRFEGKEKMMALGEYPLVTLAEARERHFVARKTLAAGVDPMARRIRPAAIRGGRFPGDRF
jgi:hypothetical protein